MTATPTIRRELTDAALSIGQLELAHLRKLGLLNPGVVEMGRHHHQFGIAKVEPVDGGLYTPSSSGVPAMIVPVFEGGDLIDLLAFRTAEPEHWWLRKGLGGLLGLWSGWGKHEWADSVRLHATPLEWLQAGGEGLCVVDWDAPELHRINTFQNVTVATVGLRGQLLDALKRPYRLVPVDVVTGEMANAA